MFSRGFVSGSSDAPAHTNKRRYEFGEKGPNIPADVNEQAMVESMGFAKNMRNLREELKWEMDFLRNEIKESLVGTVEATKSIMREVISKLNEVRDVHDGQALKMEFLGVREEVRSGLDFMMQCLDSRLREKTATVTDEINMLLKHQEELEQTFRQEIRKIRNGTDQLESVVSRSGAQIVQMLTEQQSFTTKAFHDIEVISREDKNHYKASLAPSLDAQFYKHLRLQPLNVDLSQVMQKMDKGQLTINKEMKELRFEFARIQQELNMEFNEVMLHFNDPQDRASSAHPTSSDVKATPSIGVKATTSGWKTARRYMKRLATEPNMLLPGELDSPMKGPKSVGPLAVLDDVSAQPKATPSCVLGREDTDSSISQHRCASKRVRTFYTQTERSEVAGVGCQTDIAPKKVNSTKKEYKGKTAPTSRSVSLLSRGDEKKPAEGRWAKPMGADAEAMKKKAMANLIKPQYNVYDDYWDTGCCQRVARSSIYQNATFLMIIVNAIWIGIDLDWNDEELLVNAHPVFQIAENFFCTYFTLEVILRFGAFKIKKHCLRDYWFIFDFFLAAYMILETWIIVGIMAALGGDSSELGPVSIFRVVRIAKMARMARIVRLVRSIPELVVLLKGIFVALRSVVVFMGLWTAIIYIYAVILKQVTETDNVGKRYFGSIPAAMNTLLVRGIMPDFADLMDDVGDENRLAWPILMSFFLLASITMMNMLVGVLVQVVSVLTTVEKESMTVSHVASGLRGAMVDMGMDTEKGLNLSAYRDLLVQPEISTIVNEAGVDIFMLLDMSDVLFEALNPEGAEISFELFIQIVLSMRSNTNVTVKDMSMQLRFIQRMLHEAAMRAEEGTTIALTDVLVRLQKDMQNAFDGVTRQLIKDDDDDEQSQSGS